jgi:hypothetical protein
LHQVIKLGNVVIILHTQFYVADEEVENKIVFKKTINQQSISKFDAMTPEKKKKLQEC